MTSKAAQLYTLTAGNIDSRPGHRHDCAEVRITWQVQATSKEDAVDISRRYLAKTGKLPGRVTIELGNVSTKLQVTEVDES